uniref:Immunoglobulin C2-set-like ligand-binding domain-containing protein n=1 Tax=Callorhinchus milii TaxID=7868 RepID=A0A4W3GKQ6_CALMI
METPGFRWFLTLNVLLLCREGVGSCTGGEMRVSPSTVVRLGSEINVSCILKEPYDKCSGPTPRLKIILDNSKLLVNEQVSGSEVTARHHRVNSSESSFACKLECAKTNEQLVCGVDVRAGLPPDQPQNLTCVQNGREAEVSCRWDPGQPTFLKTTQQLW